MVSALEGFYCVGKLSAAGGVWVIIGYADDEKGSWADKIVART